MENKNLFSNNFIDIVSKMLTLFTFFIYVIIIFNINVSVISLRFISFIILIILSILQFYFFIIKNRKAIILTNLHLSLMLGFGVYNLIKELIFSRVYTRDINGLVFFIVLILLSIFIINKYKTPKVVYNDLDELGKY